MITSSNWVVIRCWPCAWFRAYAYAQEELAVAAGFGPERQLEFLTGRFAGKEAVLKVIGTGVGGGVAPRQVVILRAYNSAPCVAEGGRAARCAEERGIAEITVFISHNKDLVVAAAIGA